MQSTNPPQDSTIYRGKIVYWNDQKGYGFIKIPKIENNIFFHISAYAYEKRRPQKDRTVSFLLQKNQNKIQALRIVERGDEDGLFEQVALDARRAGPHHFEAAIYLALALLFYIILSTLSITITIASLSISILTFILYSIDKRAAINAHFRIPEASLHLASLLGGWPGALIARPILRHKTNKNRFIIFFWLSVIINFFSLYILIICLL